MANIKPFEVELWMDAYETSSRYNIAETCAASISLDDLHGLSEKPSSASAILPLSTKLTYGAIRGTDTLCSNLSQLYSAKTQDPLPKENILITAGAIAANFLVLYSLLGPGDHVICHWPTYQQLYAVPASLGAEVSLWKAIENRGWHLDIEELEAMIKPKTKLIIINNPNNPTGAAFGKKFLLQLVAVARKHDLTIMSDEVYRPLFHGLSPMDDDFPPSLISLGYPKTLATGSMSKAWSLAGIRIGWIASRSSELIDQCAGVRHYTAISASQVDQQIASFALDSNCVHALLARNIQLAKRNLVIVENFIYTHQWACEWVKPCAGTTCLVRFTKEGQPVDDVALCKLLMEKRGILFCPGSSCFGDGIALRGYVRMGYVNETAILEAAMVQLVEFMKLEFQQVPLAGS